MKKWIGLILSAGLIGGVAEIIWVMAYGSVSHISSASVAQHITASFFPALIDSEGAIYSGIAIHLVLSILLAGIFIAFVWRPCTQYLSTARQMLIAAVILSGVWAYNFFIALPVINPPFVSLMPYSITLVSKILFGVGMGWVLAKNAPHNVPARSVVAEQSGLRQHAL